MSTTEKKPYDKPKVIYAERIEIRAVGCAQDSAGNPTCESGPIQS